MSPCCRIDCEGEDCELCFEIALEYEPVPWDDEEAEAVFVPELAE